MDYRSFGHFSIFHENEGSAGLKWRRKLNLPLWGVSIWYFNWLLKYTYIDTAIKIVKVARFWKQIEEIWGNINSQQLLFLILKPSLIVVRHIYRYGHINVSTLDDPYQTHTSGGPIWIILFFLERYGKNSWDDCFGFLNK